MEIYTIGFAGKTAERFFESLKAAGVRQLVDIRLNNVSQLAGFTKKTDLPYFLRELAAIEYRHEPVLTPTPEMLNAYRGKQIPWAEYETQYLNLLRERDAAHMLDRSQWQSPLVLLCSEPKPDRCHRRLAAEHLQSEWPGVNIAHL